MSTIDADRERTASPSGSGLLSQSFLDAIESVTCPSGSELVAMEGSMRCSCQEREQLSDEHVHALHECIATLLETGLDGRLLCDPNQWHAWRTMLDMAIFDAAMKPIHRYHDEVERRLLQYRVKARKHNIDLTGEECARVKRGIERDVLNELPAHDRAAVDEWNEGTREVRNHQQHDMDRFMYFARRRLGVDRHDPYDRIAERMQEYMAAHHGITADDTTNMTLGEWADILERDQQQTQAASEGAQTQARSAPMSKTELAKRIQNRNKAHPRDVEWERFDLQQVSDRKWTVRLDDMDDAMRRRVEQPIR